MQQWVNDQLEEWKKEKKSPGRPLDEYGTYIGFKKLHMYCVTNYVRS